MEEVVVDMITLSETEPRRVPSLMLVASLPAATRGVGNLAVSE